MQANLAFPQSLAEKYRPMRIADFVVLDRPKKVLTAFCKRPTSGAWLFVGPSGVGKSTMALALAAELQAELHKIPSQKCNAQTIEDTVRQCWYAPLTPGGFHIVLADEADQMTAYLDNVWHAEGGNGNGPDLVRLAKDSRNNVRDCLMRLEVELMAL